MIDFKNGNVGIGTKLPTGTLHTVNTTNTNQIVLQGNLGAPQTANINFTTTADNTLSLVTNYAIGTSGAISLQPGTQEVMRVAQDLVHVLNPNSKTPLFRVDGQILMATGLALTAPDLLINGGSSKIQMLDGGTQNAEFIYNASGDNSLLIKSNYAGGTDNFIGLDVAGAEIMHIKQGGLVGIGTSTPGGVFDVQVSGKKYLFINSVGGLYEMGDIDNGLNHTKLVIDDTNQSVKIIDTVTTGLNLDFNNDVYSLGDTIASINGTFLKVDDINKKIVVTNTQSGTLSPFNVPNIPEYANNAAAVAGGLAVGDFYHTTVVGDAILKVVI